MATYTLYIDGVLTERGRMSNAEIKNTEESIFDDTTRGRYADHEVIVRVSNEEKIRLSRFGRDGSRTLEERPIRR